MKSQILNVQFFFLLFAACANPVAPPGGPPDRTPPAVAEMEPADQAVNVETDALRLVFSEYVDAASFARAFSITPEPEGRLDFRWRGRRVTVELPEALRDSTTYILTIDTNLRDANGVALGQPITLAFSTGPRLNRGHLAGRVAEPQTGGPAAGLDVYAYALDGLAAPDSLPAQPDYRTQTDEAGAFQLDYLREGPYFVLALEDQNRNRRPDLLERFAVPPQPALIADSAAAPVSAPDAVAVGLAPEGLGQPAPGLPPDTTGGAQRPPPNAPAGWITTVLDTIPPELQRVQPLSSERLVLRFSEPVTLPTRDPQAWALRDTSGLYVPTVRAVYTRESEPRLVYLTVQEPLPAATYRLTPGSVADSSGTRALAEPAFFEANPEADTLGLRFEGFSPPAPSGDAAPLGPGEVPGVRLNQPVDSLRLRRLVALSDTSGAPLPFAFATPDGTTYRLQLDTLAGTAQVTVDGAALDPPRDTLFTQSFELLGPRSLGELAGVAAADTSGALVVELIPTGETRGTRGTVRVDESGRFRFGELPDGGQYRLRLFVDRNGNGRWDGGRIMPYEPAEPIAWYTAPEPIRARWETVLPDTLRVE